MEGGGVARVNVREWGRERERKRSRERGKERGREGRGGDKERWKSD